LSGLLGAFLGGTIAVHAPADLLQKFFGLVVLLGALRMLLSGEIAAKGSNVQGEELKVNFIRYLIFGSAVGVISGLSGIGGGVILVPAMIVIMRFGVLQAVDLINHHSYHLCWGYFVLCHKWIGRSWKAALFSWIYRPISVGALGRVQHLHGPSRG
jgi:hypothetical protein